ncbi:MAG: hypothetical protein H0U52_16865 [Chloroflexi bacterium]|nr:hypothetical protein [Chloroflexota bacterium]
MTDMIDLQQAAVADHIAELIREGEALRAERTRDHLRQHGAATDEALAHPIDLPSRRVRLGRWLVAFGEAIAGPARPARQEPMTIARAARPCDDGPDRLQPAA